MFRKFSNKDRLEAILAAQRNTNARISRIEERLDLVDEKLEGLARQLTGFEKRRRRSVKFAADLAAVNESAQFMNANLIHAEAHSSSSDVLRAAVAAAPEGLHLEFGVASGRTLRLICESGPRGRVVGFDTFTGLPEDWRTGFRQGKFAQDSIPHIEGAELQIGLFAETLEPFLTSNNDQIAFMHLDADLYSSTKYVLDKCTSRLADGAVLLFDEYYNYPGWQEHEHKAFLEWADANNVNWEYLGFAVAGEQVSVRIKNR